MIEEVCLPAISEHVDSGDIIEILVRLGDSIEKDQGVVTVETEKTSFEVPSPIKGKIVEICVKQGDPVKVGQTLIKVDIDAGSEVAKTSSEQSIPPAASGRQAKSQPEIIQRTSPPNPAVKIQQHEDTSSSPGRSSQESKADIGDISGMDQAGQIPVADGITDARTPSLEDSEKPIGVVPRPLPDFTQWGEVERKKISVTRKKIADLLTYTWSNIPQVTQYDRADITHLEESRVIYNQRAAHNGAKLTMTSIALKVAAFALRKFPEFNASFDSSRNEIIYKKYIHISVAIDTDHGLLVPVLRDVDQKSVPQLSEELKGLAMRTRQRKVSPEEMIGGNFTISNLGGLGGTGFAPILYWPQVAILGISRASWQPCMITNRVESRLILPLSLSYDHRVIDGAQGLRFLRWIADCLENPLVKLLENRLI